MMKILNVNTSSGNYEIVIDKNLFNNFGLEIKKVYNKSNIVIITDYNLCNLYKDSLANVLAKENYKVNFIVVEPGESSKSLSTLEYVYSKLISYNITRSDLIVAFGGGVVGDLAGFSAATFLRGINYIQIPTSLISQVDSSVGGKVAINLKEGKNLAGNFYHPLRVLIDPDILLTLPEKYYKDGLGEVIKYACIKDSQLFNLLMNTDKNLLFNHIEQLIYTCCNIKKNIVEQDEKDKGERMILNFGHTIGHALEKHSDYHITHGEAVAIGMLYITKNSENLGFTEKGTFEKIKSILDNYDFNYNIDIDFETLENYFKYDKKNLSNNINLVLLRKVGDAFIYNIPITEVKKFTCL